MGGICTINNQIIAARKFQVVPPCGGHPMIFGKKGSGKSFQVVPPGGGHPLKWGDIDLKKGFQVVPPCGGHLG